MELDIQNIGLRDYFAAKAMQGILSNPELTDDYSLKQSLKANTFNKLGEVAYKIADDVISERKL